MRGGRFFTDTSLGASSWLRERLRYSALGQKESIESEDRELLLIEVFFDLEVDGAPQGYEQGSLSWRK